MSSFVLCKLHIIRRRRRSSACLPKARWESLQKLKVFIRCFVPIQIGFVASLSLSHIDDEARRGDLTPKFETAVKWKCKLDFESSRHRQNLAKSHVQLHWRWKWALFFSLDENSFSLNWLLISRSDDRTRIAREKSINCSLIHAAHHRARSSAASARATTARSVSVSWARAHHTNHSLKLHRRAAESSSRRGWKSEWNMKTTPVV